MAETGWHGVGRGVSAHRNETAEASEQVIHKLDDVLEVIKQTESKAARSALPCVL